MRAEMKNGYWTVTDPAGGVWVPDDLAESEIMACADPAAAVLEMCKNEPMRGKWHA